MTLMKMKILNLILILFALPLMMSCQKQSSASQETSNVSQQNVLPVNGLTPSQSEMVLNSAAVSRYTINVATNSVTNTQSNTTCSLASNSNWQTLKQLYLSHGICEYRYTLAPNQVTCMALPVTVAEVKDLNTSSTIILSTPMCSQNYFSVCGAEYQSAFNKAISDLATQLNSSTGCNL
jgi:hypothetical protein